MTPDEARREQRDALQQYVDHELDADVSCERSVLIQNVTRLTRKWIWSQPAGLHRLFDDILASSFVDNRYRTIRREGRPNTRTIAEREAQAGGQLPLPEMEELIRWRWASRNGKVEKSVWQSTLGELDALDADYEARQIDMAAKRRYLFALRRAWRLVGLIDAGETVEGFYRRSGNAA